LCATLSRTRCTTRTTGISHNRRLYLRPQEIPLTFARCVIR
jgi:hypothetical protein